MKTNTVFRLGLGIIIVIIGISASKISADNSPPKPDVRTCQGGVFARLEGLLHGIVFDDQEHMYVGKSGKTILRVSLMEL
jgi:hypothetical protein